MRESLAYLPNMEGMKNTHKKRFDYTSLIITDVYQTGVIIPFPFLCAQNVKPCTPLVLYLPFLLPPPPEYLETLCLQKLENATEEIVSLWNFCSLVTTKITCSKTLSTISQTVALTATTHDNLAR